MSWLKNLFGKRVSEPPPVLKDLQDSYHSFQRLLECNQRVLMKLGDLEEKVQGEYLFDINYVRGALDELYRFVQDILAEMVAIGGEEYLPLRKRFLTLCDEIDRMLPGQGRVAQDDFTIFLDEIDAGRIASFGSKNAQLGEMKSRLGLPVPAGFAISAWAYNHFIQANDLQERISARLARLDIRDHADLLRASEEIQQLVLASPVPDDLAEEIERAYRELRQRMDGAHVSLRSSAIGEDTLFSFAGQYASFLNIGEGELVECYRRVIASKFTPKAIYYFLSHTLTERDLAMAVGCIEMIDSAASGVIYTRDPVAGKADRLMVHAVLGLGKYLVDGTLTPDVYEIARSDGKIVSRRIADKPVRLILDASGGTVSEPVPPERRRTAALAEETIQALSRYAQQLEEHYGCPQDIEFAVDAAGRISLLQTRPLRVLKQPAVRKVNLSQFETLLAGGITVYPGAGGGPVAHVRSVEDLIGLPAGAVLAAEHPFPGLVTALLDANALLTEVGSVASHTATLAREYRVPSLAGVNGLGSLTAGRVVTVDATGGAVYDGLQPELIDARRPGDDLIEDTPTFQLLRQLLPKIVPLSPKNLEDVASCTPESCRTIHDITRFCHQKAIEEISLKLRDTEHKEQIARRLVSEVPLPILLIFLDEEVEPPARVHTISVADVACNPLQALMNGIHKIGWPQEASLPGWAGGKALATAGRDETAARAPGAASFAFVGGEYMLLSLRLGYHLTTIEAMSTPDPSKNFIRLEYKSGGGALERRIRRVKLITDLLTPYSFEHSTSGDYLNTTCSYFDEESTLHRLEVMGRLMMLTKQLDMALSTDAIAAWYTNEIRNKLDDRVVERPAARSENLPRSDSGKPTDGDSP